uniref:Uncharacterized protein n=1 Tax=Helicotheca tamesis TaxID=374047 RepID=A0A7S2MKQ9_9STRA
MEIAAVNRSLDELQGELSKFDDEVKAVNRASEEKGEALKKEKADHNETKKELEVTQMELRATKKELAMKSGELEDLKDKIAAEMNKNSCGEGCAFM